MKEKYIIASGINESELLRTMSRFGRSTLGVRVLDAFDLAADVLARAGVPVPDCLTRDEEIVLIRDFMDRIGYFASGSYADACDLADALRTLRGLVTNDDENVGIRDALRIDCPPQNGFPEKNEAIYEAYRLYTDALGGRADRIGLVRLAVSVAKAGRAAYGIPDGEPLFDAEYVVLEEFPPEPLGEMLIRSLSGVEIRPTTMRAYLGHAVSGTASCSYTSAYGGIIEAEDILKQISDSGKPLDDFTVACAEPTGYAQLFFDLCAQHDVPVTISQGLPITATLPAGLLRLLYEWDTSGYHGADALSALLFSPCFDRKRLADDMGLQPDERNRRLRAMAETAGNLRLDFDRDANAKKIGKLRPLLEKKLAASPDRERDRQQVEKALQALTDAETFVKLPDFSFVSLIRRYACCRKDQTAGPYDRAAAAMIADSLNAFLAAYPPTMLGQYIPQLLKRSVCPLISREGALHITTVEGAVSSLRGELFICGLSAADFPGTPEEDHLLLDMDVDFAVVKPWAFRPDSYGRVERRKQSLSCLIRTAAALGVPIRFSYADYDLCELKDRNPSSVLFTIWQDQHPGTGFGAFDEELRKVGFSAVRITSRLSVSESVPADDADKPISPDADPIADPLSRAWSPTAIGAFFDCGRLFELKYLRGFADVSPDDPLDVVRHTDVGNMAHAVMQSAADKQPLDPGVVFDEFLISRPPMLPEKAASEKQQFVEMMDRALKEDNQRGRDVLSAENELCAEYEGVTVKGYPDRVETDGHTYYIADFKTGSFVTHKENDVDSCLQALLYAWMWNQTYPDRAVTSVEYRYLRKDLTVSCAYDSKVEERIHGMLTRFRDALRDGIFSRPPVEKRGDGAGSPCRFCRFKRLCGRAADSDDKEDHVNE